MADKILNLKLKYKNKYLDIAKYQRDFKDKFFIGSDKHLFWQILDNAFPKKHAFVTKSKNDFTMHLLDDMSVSVIKDGKTLSEEQLKKERKLQDKKLILDRNSKGEVVFDKYWSVEYSFNTPYKYVPSKEELAVFHKYHIREGITKEQKFTRIFLLLGLLFTLIGIFLFEATYVPPARVDFRDRLRSIEQQATLIHPDFQEEVQTETSDQTGYVKASSEGEAEAAATEAQEKSSADFEKEFGSFSGFGDGSETEDLTGAIYEAAGLKIKLVQGDGSNSGSGMPAGLSTTGFSTSVLDNAGSLGDISDIGGIGDLDLGTGSAGFETVNPGELGGNIKDIKTVKLHNKAQFEKMKKNFAGIGFVKQADIKLLKSPELKSEVASIDQQVSVLKPQISQLYRMERMMIDMYGTIEFDIIIDQDGSIAAVDYSQIKGSFFTTDFLEKAKVIISRWHIKVKKPIGYSFRLTYLKR